MEEQTQHRTSSSARLRFILGKQKVDVALPTEVPLAHLLPAILPQFGAEVVEQGVEHEGWVVRRLGDKTLDEDRTLSELSVLDGETLHLRPRTDQVVAIDYDDLVDGVAEQVTAHPGTLNPTRVRWMFRAAAVACLLLGLWLVPGAGSPQSQAQLAGGLALALVLGAALLARGAADAQTATILAAAAAAYAGVAAALVVGVLAPGAPLVLRVTGAATGALLALVAGLAAVAEGVLLFVAATVFAGTLLLTGVIGVLTGATSVQVAAIGVVLSIIMGIFVPPAAFRLSGLTLPMLPTGADELNEDITPIPHQLVVDRGSAVVGYSTALQLGLGAAQSLLLPIVVFDGDGWARALVLVLALLLFLRSRHPNTVIQRWALLVPACTAVAAYLVAFAGEQTPAVRLLVLVPVLFGASALLLLGGNRLPGRRLRPYWGRAVEIFESITAIAALPILFQILHLYSFMRALAG
ncbi:type VII secretion integral membrane protein EccD [Amycolatopsis sp. cg5]|uniref:type VII secretion integral membrane protein EccD n=1 Tax=Amycolatopsis sp. cg5 TaxID=3238802 RepID=UPI0035256730